MQINPLGERVFVECLNKENLSKGGIMLPDSEKENKSEGRVVAIGHTSKLKDEIKIDDTVIFVTGAGYDFEIEGKKYKVLDDKAIIGVFWTK